MFQLCLPYIQGVAVVWFPSTVSGMHKSIRLFQVTKFDKFYLLVFEQATYTLLRNRLTNWTPSDVDIAAHVWSFYLGKLHDQFLSWTRLQRNNRCLSFYVFKGGEPGRDKVSEIDSYLFYSFYYYYSHGYSCLHSAIQGMCPMMTLALTTTKCWTWRLNPTESDLQQMRWPNNQIRSATTVKLMCRVLTLSIINKLSVELIQVMFQKFEGS